MCEQCGKHLSSYNKGPLCYNCDEDVDDWDALTATRLGPPGDDVCQAYGGPRDGEGPTEYIRRLLLENEGVYIPVNKIARGHGLSKTDVDIAVGNVKRYLRRRHITVEKAPERGWGYRICYNGATGKGG